MGSFDSHRNPYMARGEFSFNGYGVVIDERIPREHTHDEVYSYRGHWFWQWLWGVFGKMFPVSMERGRPVYHTPILIFQDKMFMTRRTWEELKKTANRDPVSHI